MIYLLIFTIPAALLWLFRFPYAEATRDSAAIAANGSTDTLHEQFHFWRGAQRGVLITVAGLAAAAPLLPLGFWPWFWLGCGVGLAGQGWFFFTFNQQLSLLRGLDPYYLSSAPHAAYFPDRLLTRLGIGLKPVSIILLCLCLAAPLLLGVAALWVAAGSL